VFGIRLAKPDEASETARNEVITWADALFDRIARDRPDLTEAVFRALSKVFFSHPDESAALQAELNAARARFTQKAAGDV
jgi:hypothetical protein